MNREQGPFASAEKERFSENKFFSDSWEQMTGSTVSEIEKKKTPEERARLLWDSILPSLDEYIEKYQIPVARKEGEDDLAFFKRATLAMYKQNQNTHGRWKDCWPTTAIEIGRTNCALGSLVLGRVLMKAGIPEDDLEYASPGPLTHAAVVVHGLYLDQTNGVVIPVKNAPEVDGIKTYELVKAGLDKDTLYKVPFRRVPVSNLASGVRTLISNLDPMIHKAEQSKPDEEAKELVQKFHIGMDQIYGNYAYGKLASPEWKPKTMRSQPEWIEEDKNFGR